MRKKFFNLKFKIILFLILILIATFHLLFNDYGIVKYMKLKKEVNSLSRRIEEIKNKNQKLQSEIDSLKNFEPNKIEQIAREKYNLIKPNEKKIDIVVE